MAASDKETVLVVGSTGNIGISAILAALNTGRNVLAVVRNETSAQKIFDYIGKKEGITTVTADVLAHDGVLGVVEQVKAGKLPHFQHVFASCMNTSFENSASLIFVRWWVPPGLRYSIEGYHRRAASPKHELVIRV